ncbi:MAG: hypothetical protein E6G34_11340 [Actinobacteria bacterium]|nr:MAG: hypothetical protein E6G34_11340 [Actinomycetota bacterium]
MKRFIVIASVVCAFGIGATPAGASNPSCAAQFVTSHVGPGFGTAVSTEAREFGAAFGAETKEFGTAPHEACPG